MKISQILCALSVANALGLCIVAAFDSNLAPQNTRQPNLKFGLWQGGIRFASNGNNATTARNATSEVKFESFDIKPAWLKATIAVALFGCICLVAGNAFFVFCQTSRPSTMRISVSERCSLELRKNVLLKTSPEENFTSLEKRDLHKSRSRGNFC